MFVFVFVLCFALKEVVELAGAWVVGLESDCSAGRVIIVVVG